MEDVISDSIWRPRFSAWIFTALLLASAVVYSVIAYTTTLRAREVGIRVALGAGTRNVVVLLVRQAMVPLAAGLVISAAGSLAFSRLLKSLLYETSPADPLACTVAAGSFWQPARQPLPCLHGRRRQSTRWRPCQPSGSRTAVARFGRSLGLRLAAGRPEESQQQLAA